MPAWSNGKGARLRPERFCRFDSYRGYVQYNGLFIYREYASLSSWSDEIDTRTGRAGLKEEPVRIRQVAASGAATV